MHIMFRDGIFYFAAIAISRVGLIWLILARQSIYLGTLSSSFTYQYITTAYVSMLTTERVYVFYRPFAAMGGRSRSNLEILHPPIGYGQRRPTEYKHLVNTIRAASSDPILCRVYVVTKASNSHACSL